jgi:4-amino-4-deoxy-L-arabinose transferase-like glycosyltransferase
MTKKWEVLFLLIILAIAAFFRLWKLNEIPPGLYPDVAINGNEALESLKTGNFKVFYPENNGREGLMMWLIALSFSIFGVSIWSIKIVAAIIGILTVFGLYLLTKELFSLNSQIVNQLNSQSVALLASFFLATSFWHTNFSRIGFRAILLPFILVFSFYFLFRGLKTQKTHNFIISGLFFGLGFYTYISFRFAILILPVVFLPYWFIYKKDGLQKKYLFFIFYFLFFIFLTALPIGLYFLKNPQDFIGRAAPVSIFVTENPIKEFFKSLILHLAMFNIYGDPNWRHNFSGSPMLPWPLGILFLIGLFYSLSICIKSLLLRSSRILVVFGFLIFWWLIMLLPGILTYEGIPHSLRVIGAIPIVYIFVSLGAFKIYQFFEKNIKNKKLLIVASILFLIAMGFSEFDKYFLKWGKNKEVAGAFTEKFLKEGEFLISLPKDVQKYVIVNESGVPVPWPDGIPMPAQTIMFIENMKYGRVQSTYLLPKDLDQVKIDKKIVIVPMKYEESLFNELSERFPEGKIRKENDIYYFVIE